MVAVTGLYMSNEQATAQEAQFSNQIDESTLKEATEEELHAFSERVLVDLFPFVRSELYALTGRTQGVFGVMLQPTAILNRDAEPDSFTGQGDAK